MADDIETLAAGRFLRLVRRDSWEYVERTNATGIAVLVPITADGGIVLVEQYRIPVQATTIELPAGLVGDEVEFAGEGILEAANRELEEETGYRAGRIEVLCQGPVSTGMSDEVLTFLFATELERVGKGGGVGSEQIKVHVIPVAGIYEWLVGQEAKGLLVDPKIYTGLYLASRGIGR